jgi:hypothetical protein
MMTEYPSLAGYDGGSLGGKDFFISSLPEGDILCVFGEVDHALMYALGKAYCLREGVGRVFTGDTLKRSVSTAVWTETVWLFRWDRPQDVSILEQFGISKRVEWSLLTEEDMAHVPQGTGEKMRLSSVKLFIPIDLEGSVISGKMLDGFGQEIMVGDLAYYAGRDTHNKPCINRGEVIEADLATQRICVQREGRSSMHGADQVSRKVWVHLSKVGRVQG